MIRINSSYEKLQASYLFSTIEDRVREYRQKNPDKQIIKLGIGDVTRPLPRACIDALHKAIDEMGEEKTFRGYGPYEGYDFLRRAVVQNDYSGAARPISEDEIFVSDGSKCDTANFQEIFSGDIRIAVPDPVYPVYVDTNVMAGRTGEYRDGRYGNIVYLESTNENGYIPSPPDEKVDLIYLCFPNNPTGAHCTRKELSEWVEYARENKALILYDAAYVAFIRDDTLPRSIYEIEGADEVAVEFRSFSKTAGFTGTRCAFTVVPKKVTAWDGEGKAHEVRRLWSRRHSTKFNGVSYPVQRAAEAVYSAEGKGEIRGLNDYYLENARLVREKFSEMGFRCTGARNSPYIWIYTGTDSWKFFDSQLEEAAVVCTPGSGFGKCGEGHIRISAFNSRERVEEALSRIERIGLG